MSCVYLHCPLPAHTPHLSLYTSLLVPVFLIDDQISRSGVFFYDRCRHHMNFTSLSDHVAIKQLISAPRPSPRSLARLCNLVYVSFSSCVFMMDFILWWMLVSTSRNAQWCRHFIFITTSILYFDANERNGRPFCMVSSSPGLDQHGHILPETAPPLSVGRVWCCSSVPFTSMELSCNATHGLWTGVALVFGRIQPCISNPEESL